MRPMTAGAKGKGGHVRAKRGAPSPSSIPSPKGDAGTIPLEALTALLGDADLELACAAARILGKVAGDRPAVRAAMQKAVASPNAVLAGYALDALGRGEPSADIVPLLTQAMAREGTVRAKAIALFRQMAAPPLEPLARIVRSGSSTARLAAVDVLASLGTPPALLALLEVFRGTDADAIQAAGGHLHAAVERLPEADRQTVRREAGRVLASLSPERHPRALAALLPVAAESQPHRGRWAARFLKTKLSADVTGAALRLLRPQDLEETLTTPLLELSRAGSPEVAGAALGLLAGAPLREAHLAALLSLIDAGGAARELALRRLADLDTARVAAAVLKRLEGEDESLRNALSDVLGRMASARTLLLRRLQPGAPTPVARAAGRALRAQGDRLPPAFVRQVRARFLDLARRDDPVAHVLLEIVQVCDREPSTKALLEEAQRLRRGRQLREAERLVHLAAKISPDDFETKYAEGLLSLQHSSLALTPRARQTDTALARFSSLARQARARLLARLATDRSVPPPALYFLGFHLSDAQPPMDAAGLDLLALYLKRAPRATMADAARTILRRSGRAGRTGR